MNPAALGQRAACRPLPEPPRARQKQEVPNEVCASCGEPFAHCARFQDHGGTCTPDELDMKTRHTLRPEERLRLRRDYARVFANRCSVSDALVVMYLAPTDRDCLRLGLSVTRRVGGAVCRNALRRRIREAFRKNKHQWPGGFDIVCIPKPLAAQRKGEIASSLARLVPRAIQRWTEKNCKG